MRVRLYGLILLAVAGIVPLTVFGYISIQRSEQTAMTEVREGNQGLAGTIAARIRDYLTSERRLLQAVGSAAVQVDDAGAARGVIDAFTLQHRHFRSVVVYATRTPTAAPTPGSSPADTKKQWSTIGEVPDRDAEQYRAFSASAIAGKSAISKVRPVDRNRAGGFAHTVIIAEPLIVAGKRRGAVVATVDLVGIWPPINAVRVGHTGFARLLTRDGQLLAHGDPEERRFVFKDDREKHRELVAAALAADVMTNQQGRKVIATGAPVPDLPWVVVVEQDVEEAYAAATAMRRDLWIFALSALGVVMLLGVGMGGFLVRALERLRAHTRVLAGGDLDARADAKTSIKEVRVLAESLNEMAASLKALQEEAAARERLATFSRVAAGLAHDLRQPIEALRGATDVYLRDPEDENARRLITSVSRRDLPRLRRFVDDLRRLARQGDIEIERVRVEPVALAQEVVDELASAGKWNGVEFTVEGEAESMFADKQLVHRAITNLAGNGAEAVLAKGPTGAVSITIDQCDEDRSVRFQVRDTGIGIEESRLAGLFRADFQSTKRSTGVGLGLGVVRHVAEAHRGKVDVSSEVGVGSTFTLTLPRTLQNEPRQEEQR